MPINAPRRVTVSFKTTDEDHRALQARAHADDVPASVIIRRALRQYLVRPKTQTTTGGKFLSSGDGTGGA